MQAVFPQVRLTKGVRYYIEGILEGRNETEELIKKVKEDIIHGRPPKNLVPGISYVSDPTAHKAVELLTQKWLTRAQWELEAVDKVLAGLDERCKQVYYLRYVEGYGGRSCWVRIGKILGYSPRHCERINSLILKEIALELGMV